MNLSSNPRSMICLFTNNNIFLWDTSANVKIPTIKIKVLNIDFTFDFPRSSSSSISMFGSNESQCSQHFLRCIFLGIRKRVEKIHFKLNSDKKKRLYLNREEEAMAEITLAKEGRHPPGNMYSFMKSEFSLYSL